MDGDIQTVSLGTWMELPNLKMSQVVKCGSGKRVKVSAVANYYQEYVKRMELCHAFQNHSEVTSVRAVTQCEIACDSNPDKPCSCDKTSEAASRESSVPSDVFIDDFEDLDLGNELTNFGSYNDSVLDSFLDSSTYTEASSSCDCCSSVSSEGVSTAREPLPEIKIPNIVTATSVPENPPLPCGMLNDFAHDDNSVSEPVEPPRSTNISIAPALPNPSTCLFGHSFTDECSGRDGGYEEYTQEGFYDTCLGNDNCLSWDPIVNPDLFGKSVGAGAPTMMSPASRPLPPVERRKCAVDVSQCFPNTDRLFEVKGFRHEYDSKGQLVRTRAFTHMTKNLVLAVGSVCEANRLSIPGEDLPFVSHSLPQLESMIRTGQLRPDSDPVLIVGAGLSAADAIITAMKEGIQVTSVIRRAVSDPSIIFNKLPSAIYPEYHEIYRMMQEPDEAANGAFEIHSQTVLKEIHANKEVEVESVDMVTRRKLKVSHVLILIGSSPNLSFLDESLRENLGVIKGAAIGRNNPVNINQETNEAVNVPGVYAMGPLVGDNFVRFLQGGAMAIASDIMRKERKGQ